MARRRRQQEDPYAGTPITDIGASGKICWVNYGDPGVGKTTLIGTGGARQLIIRSPLDHTDPLLRIPRAERPKEWVVHDWAEAVESQEYMRHEGYKEFDWMWLDGVTLFQDQGLDDIWSEVIAEKPHRAKYGADRPEYGTNMFRLGLWIRAMVAAPGFHFGVTALAFETDNLDGELKLGPHVGGKNMPAKLSAVMNLTTYQEVRRNKSNELVRVIHTKASDQFYAKDQFGISERGYIPNPTMPKILDLIDSVRNNEGSR